MSLSDPKVFDKLKSDFICGWRDIGDQPYCGNSGKHPVNLDAVYTTNGAGPHNTQLFILAADGTVLHCLPGYWQPQDLAYEIEFANEINDVWTDKELTRAEKDKKFAELHAGHIHDHSKEMAKRSRMQGFDAKRELKRKETSDCITKGRKGRDTVKTTDVIMHERMAKRPFVKYADFDTASYSDYGLLKYNKNPGKIAAREEGKGKIKVKQEMFFSRKKMKQQKNRD